MNAIRLSEREFNRSDASCRNWPQVGGRHFQLNIFPHEWFQRISRFCRLKHPQSLPRTDVSCHKHSECRFFTIVQQLETLRFGRMWRTIPKSNFRGHIFYSAAALALAVSVFVGFSRTYYLKGVFGPPQLPTLTHIHGAVFTLWTLFFLGQTLLVSGGRTDIHRRIGWAGSVFALGIALLGGIMTFHSVRAGYTSGRPSMALLLFNGLIDLVLFCGFFAFAVISRAKKEVHKRLMMLAMVSLIIPALGRFPVPGSVIPWVICAFSLIGVIYDVVFLRRLYWTNTIGALLINLVTPLRFIIADTQFWQRFAQWIVR